MTYKIAPDVARARSRVAGLSRDRSSSDPVYLDARRSLAAATIEDAVERALAKAPPLTDEQAERIAHRLRGGDNR